MWQCQKGVARPRHGRKDSDLCCAPGKWNGNCSIIEIATCVEGNRGNCQVVWVDKKCQAENNVQKERGIIICVYCGQITILYDSALRLT